MKKTAIFALSAFFILSLCPISYAMPTKSFDVYERHLKLKGDFEIIDVVTLKPGEEKNFETYAFKPVTIDFKTNLAESDIKKIKREGIGMKKVSNLKYYLKDPFGASMDVLPENGLVKVSLKNFEKFPVTVRLYRVSSGKV